jgi:hypothetical protein
MSHLPIRPMTSRLLAVAGVVVAACSITPAAGAAQAASASAAQAASASAAQAASASAARAASASAAYDIAVTPCAGAADLRLRIAGSQRSGTTGITDYTLDFTNTSSSACSLSGYPVVSMISRAGRQLGSLAGRGLTTVAPLVVLAPGATAHTTLAYYSRKVTAGHGCGPVANAYELRVYVAGQRRAMYAAMGVHACSQAGQVYLTVTQAFRAGAGLT